jgi:hypothetical protein
VQGARPNASWGEWLARWQMWIGACGCSVIQKTLEMLMPMNLPKKQNNNDLQFEKN